MEPPSALQPSSLPAAELVRAATATFEQREHEAKQATEISVEMHDANMAPLQTPREQLSRAHGHPAPIPAAATAAGGSAALAFSAGAAVMGLVWLCMRLVTGKSRRSNAANAASAPSAMHAQAPPRVSLDSSLTQSEVRSNGRLPYCLLLVLYSVSQDKCMVHALDNCLVRCLTVLGARSITGKEAAGAEEEDQAARFFQRRGRGLVSAAAGRCHLSIRTIRLFCICSRR